MSRKKSRLRWPCEVCGKEVAVASRNRFLELVRCGHTVRCGQCRRYVFPGTARVSQLPSEHVVPSMGLRRKLGRGAKRLGVLESCPLGRCGVKTCADAGAVGERRV